MSRTPYSHAVSLGMALVLIGLAVLVGLAVMMVGIALKKA